MSLCENRSKTQFELGLFDVSIKSAVDVYSKKMISTWNKLLFLPLRFAFSPTLSRVSSGLLQPSMCLKKLRKRQGILRSDEKNSIMVTYVINSLFK